MIYFSLFVNFERFSLGEIKAKPPKIPLMAAKCDSDEA